VLDTIARRCEAQKELIVHRIVKIRLQPIPFFEDPSSEKGGGRGDIKNMVIKKDEPVETDLATNLEHGSFLIDYSEISIEDVD
jgi:hypothetical protein